MFQSRFSSSWRSSFSFEKFENVFMCAGVDLQILQSKLSWFPRQVSRKHNKIKELNTSDTETEFLKTKWLPPPPPPFAQTKSSWGTCFMFLKKNQAWGTCFMSLKKNQAWGTCFMSLKKNQAWGTCFMFLKINFILSSHFRKHPQKCSDHESFGIGTPYIIHKALHSKCVWGNISKVLTYSHNKEAWASGLNSAMH